MGKMGLGGSKVEKLFRRWFSCFFEGGGENWGGAFCFLRTSVFFLNTFLALLVGGLFGIIVDFFQLLFKSGERLFQSTYIFGKPWRGGSKAKG